MSHCKLIVLLLSLLAQINLFGQKKFYISISLGERVNCESILINYDNGKKNITRTIIFAKKKCILSDYFFISYAKVNLKINYKGTISETGFFISEDSCLIKIETTNSENIFEKCVYKNAFYINMEKDFYAFFSNEFNEYRECYYLFKKSDKAAQDKLTPVLKGKKIAYFNKSFQYLLLNDKTYSSFYFFSNFILPYDYIAPDSLLLVFCQFPQKIIESSEGMLIREKISAKKNISKLKKAPPLTITLINNEIFDIKPGTDKYIVLSFWASWCKPCLNELTELKKIENEFKHYNISFVFITLDNDSAAWKRAVKKYDLGILNSCDKKAILQFGITFIPQCFLIDKGNEIIYSNLSVNDDSKLAILKQRLFELFQKNL